MVHALSIVADKDPYQGAYEDGPVSVAQFYFPSDIAIDLKGNLYVADSKNHRIRKISPKGDVSTLAGDGERGFADGPGQLARFNDPRGIVLDAKGNLYVADSSNNRIRKITPTGEVSTFAGGGNNDFRDGVGSAAYFKQPSGITIDAKGNLYVADSYNHCVRKITPAGEVSTLTNNMQGFVVDPESGTRASFGVPSGIAIDAAGNLYVAGGNRIRKITPAGEIVAFAGSGDKGGFADGLGSDVRLSAPSGMTIDAEGNLYVVDADNHRIRKITSSGEVVTFAGSGKRGLDDGPADVAQFNFAQHGPSGFAQHGPSGIAMDAKGNLYVADSQNNLIRKISPAGEVSTFVGSGKNYAWHVPSAIVADAKGNLYVADSYHINVADSYHISKVTPAGEVSTFAGSTEGFADGKGSAAQFGGVAGLAMDTAGNLYVADGGSNRIRRISPTGEVSTFAGSGERGFADGEGSVAQFGGPGDLAIDTAGNLYVVDVGNHRIRKISPTGVVSTLAGSEVGFSDGHGSAARFYYPRSIATDTAGNLYVTDSYNHRIRKITPEGEVSTFAGSGSAFTGTGTHDHVMGGFADGPGSVARFHSPQGIVADRAGNLYVADGGNNCIRKITPTGEVSTFAGSGSAFIRTGQNYYATWGFADGKGSAARFLGPGGLAIDTAGNLYVADTGNHRIRKISPKGVVSTLVIGVAAQSGGKTNIRAQATKPSPVPAKGTTPSIASFSPGRAAFGTTLSIKGKGFSAVPSKNTVTLNGIPASILSATPREIKIKVPKNKLSTGFVQISVNGKTAISSTRFVYLPTVTVSTLAGSEGGFADGKGGAERFNGPSCIAIDAAGNLYVADGWNHRIQKITPTGEVSTFAGSGERGFADGEGNVARFSAPNGIAIDAAGNLYVGDSDNHRIRKITPTGVVSTFAGGKRGFAEGKGSAALFNGPGGIAIDTAGNLYVADTYNHRIRKITLAGEVSTLAGSSRLGVPDDGASYARNTMITPSEPVSTPYNGRAHGFANGPGNAAQFHSPTDVVIDAAGNLYVADFGNSVVRKISPEGDVSTLVNSIDGYDDRTGNIRSFFGLRSIALDAAGNLYVSDSGNNRIRMVSPTGEVSTLAGSDTSGKVDGVGSAAQFHSPYGITIDTAGNLYVAEERNNLIRKLVIE
ncbi:MAG: IPT/TIG domain-containing protein [Azoarcus sp.]|jgi:sugar lactone lactonase YvrE|nr:IPT/TIG domain-containing protein [Azoarcus sp.]